MRTLSFVLIISVALIGCDNSRSLANLCKKNPEICAEYGQDSWCKKERNQVSLARIDLKEKKQDLQKFQVLISYESYIKCMSLASQIQHIKLKEKTTERNNNLLKAKAHLAELSEQTARSNHPHLLFYHWSRFGDQQALDEFLQMEGSGVLENTTAQHHLATHYIKRNTQKTLMLLFHALELYEPGTTLNPEILQTLATIFINKEKYKQAYIWLKVYQLELSNSKEKTRTAKSLEQYQQAYQLDSSFLDKVANSTLDKIKAGTFKSPKF